MLDQEHWEGLGLSWDPSQQVDIYLSGDRSCWRIAVRKDETALADKFTAAIAAIRANGKYAEINKKYFDFDVYGDK